MTNKFPVQKNQANLFSFPFWIFIDKRDPPELVVKIKEESEYRIYPPFRSADENSLPMPAINPKNIPWPNNNNPKNMGTNKLVLLASMPQLHIPNIQEIGTTLVWDEKGLPKSAVDYPMDSIRIDIIQKHDFEMDSYLHVFVEALLRHVRVLTGQWWIGRSIDPLVGFYRNFFSVNDLGFPLETPSGAVKARAPNGTERPITSALWKKAIKSSFEQEMIPLSEELYLDSQYHLGVGDLRKFVIDAATACEVEKETTVFKLWSRQNLGNKYKRGKALSGYDLTDHLVQDMINLCGRSFKDEHPNEFEEIKILWMSRGSVAHGGLAEYYVQGTRYLIDNEKGKELLLAARCCIS